MKDTNIWKIVFKVIAVLAVVAGVVYAVYHWELDKKFLAWVKNCRSKCCCCANEAEEIEESAAEEVCAVETEETNSVVPECSAEDFVPCEE